MYAISKTLTKSYIESKLSQETILAKYLNIPIEVIQDCVENNHLTHSVFRTDDHNKSMGIAYNNKGRLKVRDFGGFGFFGDIYDVIGYVLSLAYGRQINTSSKADFYFILKHIVNTFSAVFNNKEVDTNLDRDIAKGLSKIQSTKVVFDIIPREWNKADKRYWEKYGVNLNYLNTNFVIPVDEFYVNRTAESTPNYQYSEKDPCYAYILGQNRTGILLTKFYFPNRNRATQLKFITNSNCIEGLLNLELYDYDFIIITKSSKDRLSLGSYLTDNLFYGGCKIGIVNLPTEKYMLKDNEHKYLLSRLKDDGLILSFLDFDATGRSGAKYLKDTYDIPYIFITCGQFGLINYRAKDFTDLHDIYTKEEIINFIKETFNYVTTVYKNNTASSQGIDLCPF